MKIKKFLYAMAFAMLPCMFVACGDDDPAETKDRTENQKDDDNNGKDDGKTDVTPIDTVMESQKQKEYLEDVAMELNGKVPVSDFEHYVDLAKYVDETYCDDDKYDWDAVGDWAEDILDGLMSNLIKTTEEERYSYSFGDYSYISMDVISLYKSTVLASNFTGHWTARNGKWNYSEADDLQFIFKNEAGKQCVLKLTTSGSVSKVYLFDLDDWKNYGQEERGNTTIYKDYVDRTQYTIGVPEKIEVTLTEDGKSLITQTVNTQLSSITSNEFDLSKSSLTFSSLTTFDNGYEVNVENVKYTSSAFACRTFVKKGKETLITVSASGDLSNVPKKVVSDWFYIDDDEVEDLLEDTNAKNVVFAVDVLGKVQVKGTISDAHKLFDYMDEAYDNDENESKFKTAIANANKCYEAFVYYNGGKAKQAFFSLTPLAKREYDYNKGGYRTVWDAEATICFPDDTSYSFESYFNEDDFKDLIDAIERQGDNAEDMWD